jgi:hypothetical protein
MARQSLRGLGRLIFRGFMITHFRHTTLGRTPLDEGSARRKDLYLTTHRSHGRQTSMTPAGLEPTIPVSERPQTHALDCAATGIAYQSLCALQLHFLPVLSLKSPRQGEERLQKRSTPEGLK